jgi:hypothetical protein
MNELLRVLDLDQQSGITEDELKKLIAAKLLEYLSDDPQKVVRIMYRLDIDEDDFHRAMAATDPPQISRRLAGLIIARQKQKLKSRRDHDRR